MKRINKIILSLLFVVVAGFLLVACDETKKSYDVTFNANGGTLKSEAVVSVDAGEKVAKPTDPERTGYVFKGWFLSDDSGQTLSLEWKFTNPVEIDFTLYAKWEEVVATEPTETEPSGSTEPTVEAPITIEAALNLANNSDVWVVGGVYDVGAGKLYISDSENGKVLVETQTEAAVGKKVEVKGKLIVAGNVRKIVADTVTITGDMAVEPVVKTLAQINSLQVTAKAGAWYQYVKVIGRIDFNEILQEYSLVSDDGYFEVILDEKAGVWELEDFIGERVELEAILLDYDAISDLWKVVVMPESIEIELFNAVDLEAMLNSYFAFEVKTQILGGGLALPASHPDVKDLEITWEVDIPEIEILELNEATGKYNTQINIPDEDVPGVLTATINYKDTISFEMTINVTVLELMETSLKQALQDKEAMSLFKAVVIGFAAGQNITFKSYIVQDLEDPSVMISVDYNASEGGFGSYIDEVEVGDILLFAATYRDTGRPTFIEVDTVKLNERQDPVYDLENAHVLNADTFSTFPGPNAFVKLESPFFRYSTSALPAPTNWARIGFAADDIGTNFGVDNNKSLAFLIRPLDELMGENWRFDVGIPVVGNPGVQYEGDIYGFVLYESDTYFQFVAVSTDHFIPHDHYVVKQELKASVPAQISDGNLVLATTHDLVDGVITWVSSEPTIIASDGTINYPESNTSVELTAQFETATSDIVHEVVVEILVAGKVKVIREVSEAILMADGDFVDITGIVLLGAYANSTTGGQTLDTVLLIDKTSGEIAFITGLESLYLSDDIKIGDELEFSGQIAIDSENKLTIAYLGGLEVIRSDVEIPDYHQNAISITSHEEGLLEFAKDFHYGQVFKMEGLIYFNSTTNTGRVTNLRFHMNYGDTSATSDIQYNGRSLVYNVDQHLGVLGEDFLDELFGFPENPGTGRPGTPRNLTMYFIVKGSSASYYYLQLISADDVISNLGQTVKTDVELLIPESIVSGDLTLLTTHEYTDDGITWTSDKEDVIAVDGTVTYGSEDVVVTLGYAFKVDGKDYYFEIEVTVVKPAAFTVSEIVADAVDGDLVLVEGVVAGFHWNGSGTLGELTNGIILKDPDNNNVLYVVGLYGTFGSTRAEYVVGEQTLAIGDLISFGAEYQIATTEGHAGRQTLVIPVNGEINIISSDNPITYDLTEAIEVSTMADFEEIAEDLPYGQIYKLVGPFSFRGSAGTYGTGVNLVVGFGDLKAATDFNLNPTWAERAQRFSIKFDGNVPNLGNEWWIDHLEIDADNYPGTSPFMNYDEDSYIYVMIGHALPRAASAAGYIQLVVLDPSWISTTRVFPTP